MRQEPRADGFVLLIEDDPRDAELALEGMRLAGLADRLYVLSDGEAAARFLVACASGAKPKPAAVLLDLKLPKVDGFELLETALALPGLAGVPVTVLTSSFEAHDRDRAEGLGCASYVVKPTGLIRYMEVVRDLI